MMADSSAAAPPRRAIVDIGSNTIRLVVFGGPLRAPAVLFNEKVVAGLGRGLGDGGRLDPAARELALAGLARFAALIALLPPLDLRVVATAAVREAADGADFLDGVRALGLPAELLGGDDEALAAAHGVLCAHPGAAGLVADMGGGSLELARIGAGEVHERVSLPLGAMRVAAIRAGGTGRLRKALRRHLAPHGWLARAAGQPLYLVGGAWRALARVQMHLTGWPLPVLDGYAFEPGAVRRLKAAVRGGGPFPGIKPARAAQLDDAAALLAGLAAELAPARLVVSAFGLREGLLFAALDPATRARDPLIAGLHHAVAGRPGAAAQARALLEWSDPLFADEPPTLRRLRHAAALIAGAGWASSPDFRVADGEDAALHGAWIGVNHAERAALALALHIGLGGDPAKAPALLARLAPAELLERARCWGLALRLGQRLGSGAGADLAAVPLRRAEGGAVTLTLPAALADAVTRRRLERLAQALGQSWGLEFSTPKWRG